MKLSKTVFDAPQMEFLGMIIGQGKVEMDRRKLVSSSRSRTGLLHMSIRISKRSSNSPQSMPKRAEMTEVSIGEVQTYIVLCDEGTLVPQWE